MASFEVPDTGLALVGAPDGGTTSSDDSNSGLQALRFVLPRDLVKELVQQSPTKSGKIAEICLGKQKSILYSGKSRDVLSSIEPNRTEVYRHSPDGRELQFRGVVGHVLTVQNKEKGASTDDDAILKLRNQLREHNQEKELHKTRIANRSELPPALSGRRALAAKSKKPHPALKAHRPKHLAPTLTRSLPSSPSLSASRSPSLHPSRPPTSTPTLESPKTLKLKALRVPILHLLAIRPVTEKSLQRLTRSSQEDCAELVNKFSKPSRDDSGLVLSDRWYKELDVWKFPYSDEDRKLAIDNAISAFDRLRLSKDDKQWDMLLRSEKRGKGQGRDLSRLNLHNGPAPPAIKVSSAVKPSPKPESKAAAPASTTSETRQGSAAEKSINGHLNLKRDSAQRSHSQPAAKKQKIGEREADSKALVTKQVKKAEKSAAKTKSNAKQSSKIKSSEYIEDSSDDSADEKPTAKQEVKVTKPKASSQVNKTATKSSSIASNGSVKRKAEAEPHRAVKKQALSSKTSQQPGPQVARKQPSTSSAPAVKSASRPRVNSSPSKPSPLGSSPPTNASDFESDHHYNASSSSSSPLINELKRGGLSSDTIVLNGGAVKSSSSIKDTNSAKKAAAALVNGVSKQQKAKEHLPTKRHRPMPSDGSTSASSPSEDATIRLAQKFKASYAKYYKFYREVEAMKDPPEETVLEVHRWNDKLEVMKAQIYKDVESW